MLSLDREELRQLRRGEWSIDDLSAYKLVRDAGVPVHLPEDMELLQGRPACEIDMIFSEGNAIKSTRDFQALLSKSYRRR